VRLRPVTPEDAPAIAAIYAPIVRATPISFEIEPPDVVAIRKRIVQFSPAHVWLVAEDDSVLLGYAYGGPFRARPAYRWSTETTVYVDAAAHRRGVGLTLYTALFRLLAAMGYHRAFAGITLPNAASVGLHRAAGFVEAGVFTAPATSSLRGTTSRCTSARSSPIRRRHRANCCRCKRSRRKPLLPR
jgi:L-amino acid N-acyltransferase YncA